MPGTVAIVILGNALAGEVSVGALALSASLFSLGVIGLILDARLGVPGTPDDPETVDDGSANTGEPPNELLPRAT